LLQITHERGYLIPAVGDQYRACADRLAASILNFHSSANITILTNEMLPFGDQGGFANDWQCFAASPYRETIKLEADMLCTSPIDHWWSLFEQRDVVVSQGCRDYYNRPGISRHYRQIFDNNNLPDIYNAITYWRVSQTAKEFFNLVHRIFEHWNAYKVLLKYPDEFPTTDVVYGIAAVIMGPERITLPPGLGPTIVHMKHKIIQTMTDDWTQELVWENINPGLKIGTVAQWGLVHYHIKEWANE
jgi:hypothetical protein